MQIVKDNVSRLFQEYSDVEVSDVEGASASMFSSIVAAGFV